MRIKRTDRNFTVRKKADRTIHYAGQWKKYTKNTMDLSPRERQDAFKHKNLSGAKAGAQMNKQGSFSSSTGEIYADDTGKPYQQEHENNRGISSGDYTALGNIHLRKQLHQGHQEQVLHGEQPAGERQMQQCQHQYQHQQQINRPSAYHESTIKTKEPVLHRKEEMPLGVKRTDSFSLKDHQEKREKVQKQELSEPPKAYRAGCARESQPAKTAEKFSAEDTERIFPASGYEQSFDERRERQISRYKKEKFLKAREQGYQKAGRENTDGKTGAVNGHEIYAPEMQPFQMQKTAGEADLSQSQPQAQNKTNLSARDSSHIRTRNAGDSIRRRDGEIPGRKRQDETESRSSGKSRGGEENKSGKKDKSNKKGKSRDKNTRKDTSPKNRRKSRKDRAAAFRRLSYVSDKLSQEEQKDSLLKVAKDLLIGKAKAAVAGTLLSIGASLLPVLVPAFIVAVIITLLFNSPFSILLPKLTEEPGAVETLAEYTEMFREKVQEELADPGSGDETELIYEDYEGDGEPNNMADILMVYMVKHGFGDTATVMTQKNRRALQDTFDEMTSLNITYRREVVEQSYEEEDFYGNVTIRTEEVEIKIKEVRITLLASEDIIRTGIFTEEETGILRYLMSPEVLENIEGLTGGYGSPGVRNLTPEEEERLNLGGDTGSQAVRNALARLGKPYSQAQRDSGDYYDCSSLTYYAYREAGITLSYHGSNTAASQGKLLSDRGCGVDYEDIQPGDLIFYSFTRNGRYQNISHVAVYAGNGYLVDASSSKGCVVFRPVYSTGKIVMCGRPSGL